MSQQTINNGDTGLVARTGINNNFTELYDAVFDAGSVIYVNQITDIPFSAGEYQLSDGNLYIFNATGLDFAAGPFRVPSGASIAMTSSTPANSVVLIVGFRAAAGAALLSVDNTGFISTSYISSGLTSSSDDLFGSNLTVETLIAQNTSFIGFNKTGQVGAVNVIFDTVNFKENGIGSSGSGLVLNNTKTGVISNMLMDNVGDYAINFFSVIGSVESIIVTQSKFVGQSLDFIYNISNSVTIGTIINFAGALIDQTGSPTIFAAGSLDQTAIGVRFIDSSPVPDSIKAVDSFLTSSQAVTIGTSGVFVAIGGVNRSSDLAERFSETTGGLLTYLAPVTTQFRIMGTATVEKVGGGSAALELRIAINGTTSAKTGSFTQNSDPSTIVSQGLFMLNQGDTIQLFVANNTTTSNITVQLANLTIKT